MKARSRHVNQVLMSLLVPMMVVGGIGSAPMLEVQADATPVKVRTQADNYAGSLQQPGFKKVPKKYSKDIPLQFLGINDLHGGLNVLGASTIGSQTYQDTGSVSRLAGYLNQSQKQFKRVTHSTNTFRIQAGDMVGASPANSTLLAHESTMNVLRAMKFQIGTLGNHEFDRGLPEFNRILLGQKPGADADSLVKAYPYQPSKMQEVVANVVQKTNNKPPFGYKPYAIKTVKAHGKTAKVGFIGIETTDMPHLTYLKNYQDYEFLDEAQTIAKYDKVLNKKGVKAVVVMAHTGVQTWEGETSGNAVDILQKVNQIDPKNNVGFYLAGHSHQYANAKVGKTHLVQSLFSGHAYSDTQGYVNPKTGKFAGLESHVYPVLPAKTDPKTKTDAKVAAIVKDADTRVAPKINAVIGHAATSEAITQKLSDSNENAIGELVVDGQLYEAQKNGEKPDFAMTNTGGVRASLLVNDQKEITWGAAEAVQPFGNVLQVIEMTGQQVYDALNKQYDGNNGFLQIAGLKYTYAKNGDKFQVGQVTKADGTPLDMGAKYRVVINDFLHGNTKYGFGGTPVVGSLAADTDVFVQYIKDVEAEGKTIAAPKLDRKVLQDAPITQPTPITSATKVALAG